jgi:hypothetical protein
MRNLTKAVLLLMVFAAAASAQTLTDPYEILNRHYEAIGGLDKLKAEETSYFEGKMSVAGLAGTLKHWSQRPDKSRTELDLSVLKQTMGDNGKVAWQIDANGKLRIEKDEGALAMREIENRIRDFEHLDPDSEVFTLSFEGVEKIEDTECYVIKFTNSIDQSYMIEYIETSTLLLKKSSNIRDNREMHTVYSDYREVDGILRAFRQVIENLPIPQTQVLELIEYESNIEIDPELFDPPMEDVEDFVFIDGGDVVEVPFEFIENHLYLTVIMDCRETIWVLDSGASTTVIDTEFAEELGVSAQGNLKGMGAGHEVEISFVTLPPYRVGGIEFKEQKAASMPIAKLFRSLTKTEVAGILGYDFLSRFVTRIDYANETLAFFSPDAFEYKGDGVILDAPLRGNMFTVPASVNGKYKGRWTLDLGASGTSFHYPFAEKNGLFDLPSTEGVAFGAGGKITKSLAKFDELELGGFVLDDVRISFPRENMVGAFGTTELVGNMGNTVFRHFVLYLDYERQSVIVEKGKDFDHGFPVDRSGLQLWIPDGENLEVLVVASETPADDAGFREGDIIKKINGIDVELLDGPNAVRKLLRADAGTEYTFEALRDGSLVAVEITLEDIL